jgi:hypothetical protein
LKQMLSITLVRNEPVEKEININVFIYLQ